jgi:long-chain acyl-CoA synthetase
MGALRKRSDSTINTFCQRLVEAANARPNKVAMMLLGPHGAETTTFGEMLANIRSLAYRLGQEQIAFGDRVALIGENHPHWAIAYFGIIYRGAVVVPLDPAATIEALTNFIDNSEAKLAFVSPASLEKFRAVCDRLGRQIPAVALRPLEQPDGLARYDDWAHTPTPPEFDTAPPPAKPEDIAVLMYTSGTTGTPKAVPLTHGNIYAESDGVEEVMRITEREIILSLLPLFHAYSQTVNLWLATIVGATVVYLTELGSAEIARGLKESRATALIGVPRLWYLFHKKIFDAVRGRAAPSRWLFRAMMTVNGWLRDSLGINAGRLLFKRVHEAFGGKLRLAVSGGASFDVKVAKDFHRLGFTILQGYGLTETAAAATVTRFEDNKIGSVGTPLNNVEVKVAEPNEEGIGEVLIRGPIVTPGYYRNPEANREAFTTDGWFRSGDLGRFDGQGHLYIVGRKKDVIKLPSGKNVFPEDVEAHYERSPLVSEICVIGLRDEQSRFERAEKLCAVVVPDFDYLKAHRIANAREAIRFELDNFGRALPEYQRVRDFLIRAEPLPRTTTRKVRRFELQKQLEATGTVTRQARDVSRFAFTAANRALMDREAGRAIVAAIRQQAPEASVIHPQMNLELDLGLDSLARAECMVSIEHALGVEFQPEEVAAALTVGELVALAESKIPAALPSELVAGQVPTQPSSAHITWHDILTQAPVDVAELKPILKPKPVTAWIVYALLRIIYLAARMLLRLEVNGREVLTQLQRPFLICPNHQSFLDPILLCSVMPRHLLEHIFHVGASEYFAGPLMARVARRLNIVPVDPDTNLLRAMRAGVAGLRAGKILNLYPEGQRSFDGVLQEFKKGAAILALELDVPIVPVALDGLYRVWPRRVWRLHLAKVKISFGEPINVWEVAPPGTDREAIYEAVTGKLKGDIQRMLDEMRQI